MDRENKKNTQKNPMDYQDLFHSLIKENEKKQKNFKQNYVTDKSRERKKQQESYIYGKARPRKSTETERTEQSESYQSVCPYCGKKLGFFKKWMLKNKGDYFCNICGNHSVIVISKIVVPMAIITVMISILLVLIFTFAVDMEIWSIVLIFIPFLIFFCASVFTVRLKRIASSDKRKKKPTQNYKNNTRAL